MNKKPTAEEVTQIERLMQKVVQKEISVIEAAQTILRNREAHANNAVEEYEKFIKEEQEKLLDLPDAKDMSITLLQTLANTGAEFEDEDIAVQCIELTVKEYGKQLLKYILHNQRFKH